MPLYYFNVHDCQGDRYDEVGREFPDIDAAHQAAIEEARALLAQELRNGEIHLSCYIEIADGTRSQLLVVTFEEAVTIRF